MCLLALSPGAVTIAFGQDSPVGIVIGETVTIFSDALDEERDLLIGKPAEYDESDASYPVLFLLDGDAHFHYTTGLASFLARNQLTPNLLVIAIPNTVRPRDLLPVPDDGTEPEQVSIYGRSDSFRSFLADELIPWVDRNYRTQTSRILFGHSLGGLFAIDTLISRPQLFDAYIVASPALQWNDQHLIERVEAALDDAPGWTASLFMTGGNEGEALLGGIRKLAGVLDERAPVGLQWQFEHFPLESHQSIPLRSLYRGLEFIYSDWVIRDPVGIYERYGVEAIASFYERSDAKYGAGRGVLELTVRDTALPFLRAGRLDDAGAIATRFLDTVFIPAGFFEDLAAAYREAGRTDRAIEWYRQALQVDAESEVSRQSLRELGVNP
jgi:predicted alpha/beta superfamily hydrolase